MDIVLSARVMKVEIQSLFSCSWSSWPPFSLFRTGVALLLGFLVKLGEVSWRGLESLIAPR